MRPHDSVSALTSKKGTQHENSIDGHLRSRCSAHIVLWQWPNPGRSQPEVWQAYAEKLEAGAFVQVA
jgi:hypothetical protein